MNEGSPDKPFDRACIKTLRSTSLPHSWTESRGIGDIFVNCHYLRHHSAEASIECGKLIREPSDQCCKVLVRHVTVEESTQGAEPMHHLGDRGQKRTLPYSRQAAYLLLVVRIIRLYPFQHLIAYCAQK